jgi:hypothetical protein
MGISKIVFVERCGSEDPLSEAAWHNGRACSAPFARNGQYGNYLRGSSTGDLGNTAPIVVSPFLLGNIVIVGLDYICALQSAGSCSPSAGCGAGAVQINCRVVSSPMLTVHRLLCS